MILPYSVAKRLPGLRLNPPGVKVERDRRPCWLGDSIYFKTNAETLPVACLSAMQYGWALDFLLCEIVYADLALGYVYLLKSDISDGFYRVWLCPEDAPKLGLIFPSGKTRNQWRDSLARSATVYVAVQNKCEEFFQPIGSVRIMATIGSSYLPLGDFSPNLGASSGRNPMR